MTLVDTAPVQLLTYDEAARRLSISSRTLRRMVEAGEIDVVRIRGAVRFSLTHLDDLVAARTVMSRA